MLKAIVESDLAECLEVIQKGYKTVADQFGLNEENCPDSGGATLKYEKLLANYNQGKRMFGYVYDEKLVGFLKFHQMDSNTIKIDDIVVLPEYRNKGFGKEMIRFSKQFCKDNGYIKLTLGMIDDNTILKKWYIRNGFCESHMVKYPKAPFTTSYMELNI